MLFLRFLLCLCVLVATRFSCIGQTETLPISEWQSKLSIKKDPGLIALSEVNQQISSYDSMLRCEALNLLKERSSRKNARYQIRLTLIRANFFYNFPECEEDIDIRELLESALRKCYEINDLLLATEIHLSLSNVYLTRTEQGLAIVHQLIAKELMEKEGLHLFRKYAITLYNLADILYRSSDYQQAANVNKLAIDYHGPVEFNKMDSLDRNWEMNAWNSLGLCYKRLGKYDSAFYAFNEAYALAGDDFWKGLLQGNKGDVYFSQGKYDSAEMLLNIDYSQSIEYNAFDNASITMQRLARIAYARGDHWKALQLNKKADSLEHLSPNMDHRVSILQNYSVIYKDLGMVDSAFAYMDRYKILSDFNERRAAQNRVEIVNLRLENQKNVNQIQSLNRDKSRIRLIRNFSIALILVISIGGYLYINRLRLKAKLRQQEAVEDKRRAEAEAASAKEQLLLFTENMREKTKLIEELQSRMSKKELDQGQMIQIQELLQQTILTDEDWERFKMLFTRVYPGFFIELKRQVSDITLAEQRMAALIKLRVSNKDAAGMLGVSLNSIHKTRQRLRQRLGIELDAQLDQFFHGA